MEDAQKKKGRLPTRGSAAGQRQPSDRKRMLANIRAANFSAGRDNMLYPPELDSAGPADLHRPSTQRVAEPSASAPPGTEQTNHQDQQPLSALPRQEGIRRQDHTPPAGTGSGNRPPSPPSSSAAQVPVAGSQQ